MFALVVVCFRLRCGTRRGRKSSVPSLSHTSEGPRSTVACLLCFVFVFWSFAVVFGLVSFRLLFFVFSPLSLVFVFCLCLLLSFVVIVLVSVLISAFVFVFALSLSLCLLHSHCLNFTCCLFFTRLVCQFIHLLSALFIQRFSSP
jgi:hypothetical protein